MLIRLYMKKNPNINGLQLIFVLSKSFFLIYVLLGFQLHFSFYILFSSTGLKIKSLCTLTFLFNTFYKFVINGENYSCKWNLPGNLQTLAIFFFSLYKSSCTRWQYYMWYFHSNLNIPELLFPQWRYNMKYSSFI